MQTEQEKNEMGNDMENEMGNEERRLSLERERRMPTAQASNKTKSIYIHHHHTLQS